MAETAMMNATQALPSKRKRNQVSYLIDYYYEDLGLDSAAEEDYESDDDGTHGSRKKTRSRKRVKSMPMPKKGKKQKPFRFLDLPAELRDEIYELALEECGSITLVSNTKHYRRRVTRGPIAIENDRWLASSTTHIDNAGKELIPNLLAVNKQIRDEASSYLYKQEIILEDTGALQIFIAQIGQYNRQLLSKVTVKGWGGGRGVHKGHNFAALSILSTCTNLNTLLLDCDVSSRYGAFTCPKRLARQVFRDGHYFLEAIGAAKGRYDAALDVLKVREWHFNKNTAMFRNSYWQHGAKFEFDHKKKKEFEEELRTLLSRRS